MGFITGNTNEFVVYLTDKGKETFFDGGLQDIAYYFSLSDEDSNYNILNNINFNSNLTNQDLITIKNNDSLTNGLYEVFTQSHKRGSVVDNKTYKKGLFSITDSINKDYVLYDPNPNVVSSAPITYKIIGTYKQYYLLNLNGLYLRTAYPDNPGLSDLIQNYDLFPIDDLDVNKYYFTNSSYQQKNDILDLSFLGSNSESTINNDVLYSEIIKSDELVLGENYHCYYNLYFKYAGAKNIKYNPTGTSENLTVTVSLVLGSNKIPMVLSDLQQYRTTGTTYDFRSSVIKRHTDSGYTPLVSLIDGNSKILMNYSERDYVYSSVPYTITDHFEDYYQSPIGYNFRVKASLKLNEFYINQCKNNKDVSILIEYSKLAMSYVIRTTETNTYHI